VKQTPADLESLLMLLIPRVSDFNKPLTIDIKHLALSTVCYTT